MLLCKAQEVLNFFVCFLIFVGSAFKKVVFTCVDKDDSFCAWHLFPSPQLTDFSLEEPLDFSSCPWSVHRYTRLRMFA